MARSLPGLIRADKVQKKAAKAGFDWDDISGAIAKVREELDEIEDAIEAGGDIEGEVGVAAVCCRQRVALCTGGT